MDRTHLQRCHHESRSAQPQRPLRLENRILGGRRGPEVRGPAPKRHGACPGRQAIRPGRVEPLGHLAGQPARLRLQLAKSTAEILDDLGHALAARDRDSVDLALASLAANGDLDTLNQSFIRVRALASLEDWDALLDDRSINDLLQVSRPPGVTRAIRRAVFHRSFATLAVSERDAELLDAARRLPSEFRSVAKGPPANHPDELIFQVVLALTSDPPLPTELVEGMASGADMLRMGLESRLLRLISTASKPSSEPRAEISPEAAAFALYVAGDPAGALDAVLDLPPTSGTVRVAVLAAADIDDKSAALAALDYIAADPEILNEAGWSKQIRNAIWALEQTAGSGKPSDWSTWLDQIGRAMTSPRPSTPYRLTILNGHQWVSPTCPHG